jgi:hypothetical protein
LKPLIKGFRRLDRANYDRYEKSHQSQILFEKRLLEFVVLDGIPFDVTGKIGFQRLINSLDPKLSIPSRRTLMRRLGKEFQLVTLFSIYKIIITDIFRYFFTNLQLLQL